MLKIYDYNGNPTETNVDLNDENIICATIHIVSGDEVLEVITKDGSMKCYDSSEDRWSDFYDGWYQIKKGDKILVPLSWYMEIDSYKRLELGTE